MEKSINQATNKPKERLNVFKKIVSFFVLTYNFFFIQSVVFASHLSTSKAYTGTEALIKDATTIFTNLITIVAIAAIIYFQIRKAVSDDMDHKKWDTRTFVGIVCVIIGLSAKFLIDAFSAFYK